MSNFLGANCGFGANAILVATDERSLPSFNRWAFPDRTSMRPWEDGLLWSMSTFLGNGGSWALAQDAGSSACYDSYLPDETGGRQMVKLRGTTRDSNGNPLGSVVVRCFVTSTNTFVGQCTSDSGGYYELPTPYAGVQHYITAYQTGSPDVSGTTVNTLVPS